MPSIYHSMPFWIHISEVAPRTVEPRKGTSPQWMTSSSSHRACCPGFLNRSLRARCMLWSLHSTVCLSCNRQIHSSVRSPAGNRIDSVGSWLGRGLGHKANSWGNPTSSMQDLCCSSFPGRHSRRNNCCPGRIARALGRSRSPGRRSVARNSSIRCCHRLLFLASSFYLSSFSVCQSSILWALWASVSKLDYRKIVRSCGHSCRKCR